MRFTKKFPDTITIILSISIIFILLTWIVPAGEYARETVNNVEVVVADSYEKVPANPQGLGDLLMAPIKGMTSAAFVIAFIFIVGGAFSIVNKTGAINAGIFRIIEMSKSRPATKKFIVPGVTALFSLAGATFGMSEEILVFILITIPLARALHYDAIVAAAIPVIGTGVGFAGAITNPFTIGIAQTIAEVPLFSGMGYRFVVWIVLTTIACIALQRYASRIDKDPTKSPMYRLGSVLDKEQDEPEIPELNTRRKLILLAFLAAIIALVVGVNSFDWYINEIAALFLGLAVVSAVIYKLNIDIAIKEFTQGAKDMMTAALVIALSKGLLVISEDGKIIDTLLHTVAVLAGDSNQVISSQLMFVFQCTLNFFIPSGSGQAALTMPIMAPLSDLLGISRQVAVLAFQMGDGLTNMIVPTSGVTMGVLSIAGIPYDKWFKWALPYLVILFIAALVLMAPPILFFEW
ncbi:YfcC family protein [Robertkochia sediminum]|uniref:YfcC family protein n=1 Tax=Robertkochia sediminum TaxID=2785326 RepID=UPI001933DDF3|nr:Na+/H+ antiporter NhaC family protein [Robertkochia sediminum]MBL7472939.1 putative basic amino acid antiporter YfcC [Robertkochia sediminum]